MAKILIVLGMNSRRIAREKFADSYYTALAGLLARPEVGLRVRLPAREDVELLYWTDLIPDPPQPRIRAATPCGAEPAPRQHVSLAATILDLGRSWRRFFRRRMLRLDATAQYDLGFEPPTWIGRALRPTFIQTMQYVANSPARVRAERLAPPGLRDQVQARFARMLAPETQLVLGHSLGSIIAYEGLLRSARSIEALITLGSPFGVPRMIYEPFGRWLGAAPPYPWPNVGVWRNVSSIRDVFLVPVPRLRPLFRGDVHDLIVDHGSIWNPDKTHRFGSYLSHVSVGREIARAWERTCGLQVEESSDERCAIGTASAAA